MKKFLSVLLAALMLMSLAMSANADEIVRVESGSVFSAIRAIVPSGRMKNMSSGM